MSDVVNFINSITNEVVERKELCKLYNASIPLSCDEYKYVPLDENDTAEYPVWRKVKDDEGETRSRLCSVVQAALDAFARTKSYDSILSACSYANSSNAEYRADAEYCIALRDETWDTAYQIIDSIVNNEMERPTDENFVSMLPVANAEWQSQS